MKLRGLGLCCAAALAAALPLAAAARTSSNSASQALAWFNAQRAANGIPGDVAENVDWSAKCDKHITYMQKSGQFGHEEDQASPYYSADGEWGGTHSVLAMGDTWSADHNPWESAPRWQSPTARITCAQPRGPGSRAPFPTSCRWSPTPVTARRPMRRRTLRS